MLLLVILGDRLGGWALQQAVDRSRFRYSRLYTGRAEADILLLGNSRGLAFFQPYVEELSGKRSLNLSYNGLPMDLGRRLLEDYFERYPPPERLFIEVSMCDRENPRLIAAFGPYARHSQRLRRLIADKAPRAHCAGLLSHLYRFNGEVFQRALFYLNRSDEDWLLERTIPPAERRRAAQLPPQTLDLQPAMLEELAAAVRLAQSHGTRVELVLMPYFPDFARKIENLEEALEAVERTTGLPVRNFAEALNDPAFFGDYRHLNRRGSRRFLELLLR
ncbi:MAG: hypothetical protein D6765_02330 [Bacteroidetes bacterium]|nr:MAG: hypothetical protein D6765_02330 [Bacteroidota bacterium]